MFRINHLTYQFKQATGFIAATPLTCANGSTTTVLVHLFGFNDYVFPEFRRFRTNYKNSNVEVTLNGIVVFNTERDTNIANTNSCLRYDNPD